MLREPATLQDQLRKTETALALAEALYGGEQNVGSDLIMGLHNRAGGGRVIERLLADSILPRISADVLTRLSQGRAIGDVGLAVQDAEIAYSFD